MLWGFSFGGIIDPGVANRLYQGQPIFPIPDQGDPGVFRNSKVFSNYLKIPYI